MPDDFFAPISDQKTSPKYKFFYMMMSVTDGVTDAVSSRFLGEILQTIDDTQALDEVATAIIAKVRASESR